MLDLVMDNIEAITGIILGLGVLIPYINFVKNKMAKAIRLLSETGLLLSILLDSLEDGKLTKQEIEAIIAQYKVIEDEVKKLIGKDN